MPRTSTLCEICGVELSDTRERFCGGDRCLRVFGRHLWATAASDWAKIQYHASIASVWSRRVD